MGNSHSGATSVQQHDDSKEADGLWVTVRATTTDKRTRSVRKKKVMFPASSRGTTIGSLAAEADIHIDDQNLAPLHARIRLHEDGRVYVHAENRTYYLIGQGPQTEPLTHQLRKSEVVKMGACSLQITDVQTETQTAGPFDEIVTATSGDAGDDEKQCYICFDSTTEEGDPLIQSPCQCHTPVHRRCLAQWISSKGSRLCSICKSKLPIRLTVDPPYLVLQIVRHMRGLHWSGEREYIISFRKGHNEVVIGSGHDCDLSLPDPSLSRRHASIFWGSGAFQLKDRQSSAGTFLRIADPWALTEEQTASFKMGRTMLSIKVRSKKRGGLLQWRKKSSTTTASPQRSPTVIDG